MDRMISLFIVFMSLYHFEEFAFYYLFAPVLFYTIILNASGKHHRYFISYFLGIPLIATVVLSLLILWILIVTVPIVIIITYPETDEYYSLRCVLCFFVIIFLLIVMHIFFLPEILNIYCESVY